jgi:hypothetical protein
MAQGFQVQESWSGDRMGSLHVARKNVQNHDKCDSTNKLATSQVIDDGSGFRSFKVTGLPPGETVSTGVREGVLLLSWLIVLLRTREGGEISYDWGFTRRADESEHEPAIRTLVMGEVMAGLQSTVGETAASISRQIRTEASGQLPALTSTVSLLLSNSSLAHTLDGPKDEVSNMIHST